MFPDCQKKRERESKGTSLSNVCESQNERFLNVNILTLCLPLLLYFYSFSIPFSYATAFLLIFCILFSYTYSYYCTMEIFLSKKERSIFYWATYRIFQHYNITLEKLATLVNTWKTHVKYFWCKNTGIQNLSYNFVQPFTYQTWFPYIVSILAFEFHL